MWRHLLALGVLGCAYNALGCGFAGSDPGPMEEPPIDAPAVCVPGFVDLCAASAVPAEFSGSLDINTDTDPRCQSLPQPAGGPEICLIYVSTISITNPLRAHGTRPLALAATGDIVISGKIDVSSRRDQVEPGAGSRTTGCGMTPPMNDPGGAGGGAGGSFASSGGVGGEGDMDNNGGDKGAGGVPSGTEALTRLRGGCAGQAGGNGNDNGPPPSVASGGRGGGAVYVTGKSIHIAGSIVASGAGGSGGLRNRDDGGGAGGSGGAIVLEAASITITGLILAIGGGGGEGSSGEGDGKDGEDATTVSAAPGGTMFPQGGDGGDGGTNAAGGDGKTAVGGGGGGGGGSGYIRIISPNLVSSEATIVPMATIPSTMQ